MFKLQEEVKTAGVAWIECGALQFMAKESDFASPFESGGVLLGYWSEDPRGPVVTHAVGPGPNAKHFRNRFVPDYAFHESEIARLYRHSGGTLQYLGDWHSHPGNAGLMSPSDRKTLYRIARSREARAACPLMLIMAWGPQWEPVAWTARRTRRSPCSSFTIEQWTISTFKSAKG